MKIPILNIEIKRKKFNVNDETRQKAAEVKRKKADLEMKKLDLEIQRLEQKEAKYKTDPLAAAIMDSDEPGKALLAMIAPGVIDHIKTQMANKGSNPGNDKKQVQGNQDEELKLDREQVIETLNNYKNQYPSVIDNLKKAKPEDRKEFIMQYIPNVSKETMEIFQEEIENI